jgi:hypothetical protein
LRERGREREKRERGERGRAPYSVGARNVALDAMGGEREGERAPYSVGARNVALDAMPITVAT